MQSPCGAFWFFVVFFLKLLIVGVSVRLRWLSNTVWCVKDGVVGYYLSGSVTYVWSALSTTKGHAQKRVNFGFFRHTNFFLKYARKRKKCNRQKSPDFRCTPSESTLVPHFCVLIPQPKILAMPLQHNRLMDLSHSNKIVRNVFNIINQRSAQS